MTRKAKRWAAHLASWQKSGMSQAAYCRAHGLSAQSFGYWLRKDEGIRPQPPAPAGALVPVAVAGAVSSVAEVCLPNGLRLRVPLAGDPGTVAALARALLPC